MRTPQRPQPVRLAPPLAQLRERWANLEVQRSLGAKVREHLLGEGCEVWPACQDLQWLEWIGRHGDETSKSFLMALREVAVEMKAEREAKAKADLAP